MQEITKDVIAILYEIMGWLTHFYSNRGWRRGSRLMELLPFSPTLGGKPLKDGKWWPERGNRGGVFGAENKRQNECSTFSVFFKKIYFY